MGKKDRLEARRKEKEEDEKEQKNKQKQQKEAEKQSKRKAKKEEEDQDEDQGSEEEEDEDQEEEEEQDEDAKPEAKQQVLIGLDEEKKGSDSLSNDIRVDKFDIAYNSKILFKDATLSLAHGRKYGLVAPNGLGKSTLLKNIATREDRFIEIPSHFTILYVEQEVVGDDTPALESVIAADVERTALMQEEERLMNDKKFNDDSSARLTYIHARLDQIEAYSAEARASSILTGLQFTEDMKKKATKDFSGGWRMRIALARALFCRPTLLLLDEPTNHLDLLAVIWLESYLKRWKNTLLVVSHDQNFLNSVCTDVVHIYQQKLEYYKGNYDHFKKQFTDAVALKRKQIEKEKKRIAQAKREKGKNDTTKAVAKVNRAITNKAAKTAQMNAKKSKGSKDDETPGTSNLLEDVPRDYEVEFGFPEVEKLSIPIIQVNDASFRYSPDTPIMFKDLDFGIDLDSRISLVGPNGCGKSTLLKLLTGKLTPTSGSISRNRNLVIGRFSQHFVDQIADMSMNAIQYLQSKFGEEFKEQELRGMLGRFGLTGKTHLQPIASLSGGQKSRVVLAEISMTGPHLLFLDEPTNHLDIESIDALAEALNEFEGGIVLVSHDIRLISEVCSTIWVVGDQTVTEYEGDFEDYRNELLEEFEARQNEEEEERKKKEEERRQKRDEQLKQKQASIK